MFGTLFAIMHGRYRVMQQPVKGGRVSVRRFYLQTAAARYARRVTKDGKRTAVLAYRT